jgi:hypothetical protein
VHPFAAVERSSEARVHQQPLQRRHKSQDAKTRKKNIQRVRDEQTAKRKRLEQLDMELRRERKHFGDDEKKAKKGPILHTTKSTKKGPSIW